MLSAEHRLSVTDLSRRPARTIFTVLTLAIAFVNSVTALGVLRFIAGVGLGGAMPNAAALASEYVPRRQRPFAVTLTIVCVPVGATLAGLLGTHVLPLLGWRRLFVVGGAVPLIAAMVLWRLLPESPRYLARHPQRCGDSVRMLFAAEWRADTLSLCGAFFSYSGNGPSTLAISADAA